MGGRRAVTGVAGPPPGITAETEPFWSAAARGVLVIEECEACGAQRHPPCGVCARCHGRRLRFVEVHGPGVVYSFTLNHHRWWPDLDVPYALALVEFPAHPGIRVLGRVRGAAALHVGMPVVVGFEPGPGGSSIPSFRTAVGNASEGAA